MNIRTQQINPEKIDLSEAEHICNRLGLNRKLVELLMLRGYNSVDSVNVFLHPDTEYFYSPFLMLGMKECCDRLHQSIDNSERVVVYGDYDADGICAASILSLYLASHGVEVYTHIPDRLGEGYGLNVESVERIIENVMPDLILTCDCGISAVEEAELARELGVDIVITDHHEVGEARPDCIVVNPHQSECKYPFKDLCGAGVALKIVQALGGTEAAAPYYELAAIATVADLVSMTDENRLIVQLGLSSMKNSKNLGVAALVNSLKLDKVTSSDIAFKIAPRINAAGRMGSAYRAFELFTSSDPCIVNDRLKQIIEANNDRKTLCDGLYDQAIEMLKSEDLVSNRAIVIVSDKWEKGITGILAARLVGDFKRPVFILVKNNDEYKGTCRSIDCINIYDILKKQADILKEFGGHNQAAGFSILPQNLETFKSRIYAELNELDVDMFIPSLKYDLELSESDITPEFAASLELLEPTGNNGNPKPLFMTKTSALTAAPLKNNANHTLLKSPGGLQFFAYNSYKLNTYYNGVTDRELIFELSDGDYSPRLYLRGCASARLAVNDSIARAGYLRMLNYKPSVQPKYTQYNLSELNELINDKFGILVIVGSKGAYDRVAELDNDNIVMHENMSETSVNVYTRLMVSPEFGKSFMLENYKKVIFVDYPPSFNVISYINGRTDAAVYIPDIDNRSDLFDCVKADRKIFGEYFNVIKANSALKAANIYAYFKELHARCKTIELPQFVACMSVFSQLKLVAFRPNVGIAISGDSTSLENSEIYRIIEGWQK